MTESLASNIPILLTAQLLIYISFWLIYETSEYLLHRYRFVLVCPTTPAYLWTGRVPSSKVVQSSY